MSGSGISTVKSGKGRRQVKGAGKEQSLWVHLPIVRSAKRKPKTPIKECHGRHVSCPSRVRSP